jgi:UDP-glucose 4-epimerase
MHNVFRIFKPDVVYSLAAFAREGTSVFSPYACIKDNVNAHVNTLIEAIRSSNFRKIVYFSSMAIYGNQRPPFDENMPRMPCDPYGSSKALCEEITESLSKVHGFNYSIVRPHNVFGERQSLRDRQRNVIAIFMNSIMRREDITIYGDGEQTRAFSYIMNSLPAYAKLRIKGDGEIFNIGDNRPISINDVARIVNLEMSYLGYKPSKIQYLNNRPLEVEHAHTTFLKQHDIGYNHIYSFSEGIKYMAQWADTMGQQNWLNIPVELPVICGINAMPSVWR